MCGIAGIVSLGRPVDPVALQRMTDLQRHRGPDGEGYVAAWRRNGRFEHAQLRRATAWDGDEPLSVGLGHRRLAILDLSERGAQPMPAQDGRQWIVFNGEIYNHLELREELAAQGHCFRTRTDTEVLLEAYRRWGDDCLEHIEGMFAFAIWDGLRGRLFCARDRLGIKPFYYATPSGTFAFASEMKALFALPDLDAAPDDRAVLDFLVHGNCDYGERTLVRGITALPPGHSLVVDPGAGRITRRAYWRLVPASQNGVGDRERIDALRTLLTRTVRRHLISDVRIGSCLSGGLDSSTVVALMACVRRDRPEDATALGESLFTFTACYDQPEFDERAYALQVAQASGATPHLVHPEPCEFLASFERMAWHQDMPFAEPTYYAQWRVMQAAKDAGVKVLLDGQGGDEVFGGYAKFRYAYAASLMTSGRMARFAREVAATVKQGDRYVLDIRNGYRYLPRTLRRAFGIDSLVQRALRGDWSALVANASTPGSRWWKYAFRAGRDARAVTAVQRMQVDDILLDTLPTLLRTEDRSSMAFSIEARVPLLDHKVVEYGLSLPDHLKIRDGWSKFAVRQAMQGAMPDAVRLRTSKLGFAVPGRSWLARDLRPQVLALLEEPLRCEKYVDPQVVRRWYRSPDAGRAPKEAYLGLFRILSLDTWMRAFGLSA